MANEHSRGVGFHYRPALIHPGWQYLMQLPPALHWNDYFLPVFGCVTAVYPYYFSCISSLDQSLSVRSKEPIICLVPPSFLVCVYFGFIVFCIHPSYSFVFGFTTICISLQLIPVFDLLVLCSVASAFIFKVCSLFLLPACVAHLSSPPL